MPLPAHPFTETEYELVTFEHQDFTNADLSKRHFYECTFIGCNLTGANLTRTALRDVTFVDCALTGLRFDQCDSLLLSVRFKTCVLDKASFVKTGLKETEFVRCQLHGTDFTQTDLTASLFDDCDLQGAIFEYSILERADLRTARYYAIDPERNRVKKARFSWPGLVGLLVKYGIEVD